MPTLRQRPMFNGPNLRRRLAPAGNSTLLVDLESWWDVDEESGTRFDAVGSSDLADNNTVGFTTGLIGNAARFVAASSESLSRPSLVAADQMVTFSLWWNPTANSRYTIIDSGNNGNFYFRAGAGEITLITVGFTQTVQVTGVPSLAGSWHHGVCWYNPVTNESGFNVDDGTYTNATSGGGSNGAIDLYLGNRLAAIEPLDGAIDLVGYWSRMLASAEIPLLNNGGAGSKYPFN